MIVTVMENDPPLTVSEIYDRFSLKDLIKPKRGQESLAALLFYFGMITLAGRDQYGRLHLQIPNLVTHGLYFAQLRELLLPDKFDQDEGIDNARLLCNTEEMQPLCTFVQERVCCAFSNRAQNQGGI